VVQHDEFGYREEEKKRNTRLERLTVKLLRCFQAKDRDNLDERRNQDKVDARFSDRAAQQLSTFKVTSIQLGGPEQK